MKISLSEARRAPAVLEARERGRFVLVRQTVIDHITEACKAIDSTLAQIPALLEKYGLQEYNTEPLQRAILSDGYAAIEGAVYRNTVEKMAKIGLFPTVQRKYANDNVAAIPAGLKQEIENLLGEIKGYAAELDLAPDFGALWFRSGKLRIPPQYVSAIAPRYEFPVSDKDRKAMERIREAAKILASIEVPEKEITTGVTVPAFDPIKIATNIAKGEKYTDAELLGKIALNIHLTH